MRETLVRRRLSRHNSPSPRRGGTRRAVAALGPLVALAALGAAGVAVAEPVATFSISDERPVRGQEVTLTADDACAEPATCAWSLDGDHFAIGRVASLSFETVGSRSITLTIDDGADETGPASSVTQAIDVVNRAPAASFVSTANGLAVAFDATVADADGDPLRYAWDFGDGAVSSEADPSHVYPAAGSYVVKLTVADSYESTTVSETVTVVAANRAPTAAFASTVDGLAVALDAGGSSDPDGDALTYSWDFGDGGTGEGATVRHVFPTSDSYEVSLRVDDGRGGVDAETRVVPVNRPPAATVTVNVERPLVGQQVTFTANSGDPDGDGLRLEWDVDGDSDFAEGTGATFTHAFAFAGRQVVRLRVTDDHGATTVAAAAVGVGDLAPVGTVIASSVAPLTGEDVVLDVRAEDSDGGPLVYAWDVDGDGFDDGTDTSVGPLRFDMPGIRPVRVRITDDEGSATIASLDLLVGNRPPTAAFGWSPGVVTKGVPVTFNSRAADPEGQELAEESWDLDGDGEYDDAFGSTASRTFGSAGRHEVGLRVVDAAGSAAVLRLPLVLGNRPPSARFGFEPAAPRSGDVLKLEASASDEDGRVTRLAWDLDGDNAFDDAEGPIAARRVYRAGRLRIGLKAIDDDGGEAVGYREIDVADAGGRPAAVSPRPRPKLIQPFPTVRIAGRLTRTGAVFRLVTVRAPRGTRITWNCSRRRCRTGQRAGGGLARLPVLQRRFRTGTVIEIRVTRRGGIGKYTRVTVRRTGAPVRRDLCLPPSGGKPRSCSS